MESMKNDWKGFKRNVINSESVVFFTDRVRFGIRGLASLRRVPVQALPRSRDSWFVMVCRSRGTIFLWGLCTGFFMESFIRSDGLCHFRYSGLASQRHAPLDSISKIRGAGCGVREGGGLMVADYLWGFCTGECEIPVQVETSSPRSAALERHLKERGAQMAVRVMPQRGA